jgi:hypothetical protein
VKGVADAGASRDIHALSTRYRRVIGAFGLAYPGLTVAAEEANKPEILKEKPPARARMTGKWRYVEIGRQ